MREPPEDEEGRGGTRPKPDETTDPQDSTTGPKAWTEWARIFNDACLACPAMTYEQARDALFVVAVRAPDYDIPWSEAREEARAALRRLFPVQTSAARRAAFREQFDEWDGDATAAPPTTHGLVIVGADEFAEMQFPARAYLLAPWFQEKNLVLVYGVRGVGKTIVGLGSALAVSTGATFLRWQAPVARRVLYVDGELPQETLQRRLHDVAVSIGASPTPDLRLLTPDQQNGARIPNLADPQGQRIIEDCIDHEQAELAILDNLSTLCRSGEENAAESWQVIQDWLVLLRSKRISVLLLHHAGKSGDQRGTSKREDVLDVSLRIARPKDYHPEQGARFEVHFEKGRDAFGTAVTPFEARLEGTDWSIKTLTDARDELIRKLDEEGLTYRQIAAEAGCGVATVNRVLKAAKA